MRSIVRYFENSLKSLQPDEKIDITIHCDNYVFEWLMAYVVLKEKKARGEAPESAEPPRIRTRNVIAILIAADFLKIGLLVDDCAEFVAKRMQSIVSLPISLDCLKDPLVEAIETKVSDLELEWVQDPQDKLVNRIFRKKLLKMLKEENIRVCRWCRLAYIKEEVSENEEQEPAPGLECRKAEIKIDFNGKAIYMHRDEGAPRIEDVVETMTRAHVSSREIYWKIKFQLIYERCLRCSAVFPLSEYFNCAYHTAQPLLNTGTNERIYSCCGKAEKVFDIGRDETGGCEFQPHEIDIEDSEDSEFNKKVLSIFVATDRTYAFDIFATSPPVKGRGKGEEKKRSKSFAQHSQNTQVHRKKTDMSN